MPSQQGEEHKAHVPDTPGLAAEEALAPYLAVGFAVGLEVPLGQGTSESGSRSHRRARCPTWQTLKFALTHLLTYLLYS